MLVNNFKGFEKIDKLESRYNFSRKLESKNPYQNLALYTKVHGGYEQKFLIRTITKDHSSKFSHEEYKEIVDSIRVMQAGIDGVVPVVEALENEHNYYIVENYTDGGDLEAKKIMVGTFSEKDCAKIIHRILEVLD